MKKLLVLDNYDSFTYNLVHIILQYGKNRYQVDVVRNDKITLEEVAKYDKILLSPGPGIPSEAGIMPALIQQYGPTKFIFGVSLGLQAIGEAYGGRLHNLADVLHGIPKKTVLTQTGDYIFEGLKDGFDAGRYHSWVVKNELEGLPLVLTATDEDGEVMALKHEKYDVRGVQFHPESVLTENGHLMIVNWLNH